jgi:hypothetical protein
MSPSTPAIGLLVSSLFGLQITHRYDDSFSAFRQVSHAKICAISRLRVARTDAADTAAAWEEMPVGLISDYIYGTASVWCKSVNNRVPVDDSNKVAVEETF